MAKENRKLQRDRISTEFEKLPLQERRRKLASEILNLDTPGDELNELMRHLTKIREGKQIQKK